MGKYAREAIYYNQTCMLGREDTGEFRDKTTCYHKEVF